MTRLRVQSFSISIDGYGAGPRQSVDEPLGVGGEAMHEWVVGTRTFTALYGEGDGETGVDDDFAAAGFANLGAWIMGRNIFGPVRGPWPDESWRGWWGDDPPYHCAVFVLTHYERPPLEMAGGTTFYFVTEGIKSALERAREAAAGKHVRIGGGASVANQYLAAGLVDELSIHLVPKIIGGGARLFEGLGDTRPRLELVRTIPAEKVTHLKFRVVSG